MGAAAAAVFLVLGVVLIGLATIGQQHPPQPPRVAGTQLPPPPPVSTAQPSATVPVQPPSTPVSLSIPAIHVSSALLQLGLNPDNTVQVPPLAGDSVAGWYKYSPTPGALGPAIILGHVDSAEYGPGVFYDLGALRAGQTITVTRADGTAAVFGVSRVTRYPKAQFPTAEVYGNLDYAGLRLITCGGVFNSSARSYDDNVVVFAALLPQ